MKKYIFISIVAVVLITTALIFNSCQNEDVTSKTQIKDKEWKITNEEHAAVINAATADYEASIIEAIKEKETSKNASLSISTRASEIFNEKCRGNIAKERTAKSTAESTYEMNPEKLQGFMNEISGRLVAYANSYGEDSNVTEELYLAGQKKVVDNFNNEIYNNPNLLDQEKQIILETVVLKTNIISTQISYGEELLSNTSGTARWFSFSSWWSKLKKFIECSNKTVAAGAVCYGAYQTGGWAWLACYFALQDAYNCWKNY